MLNLLDVACVSVYSALGASDANGKFTVVSSVSDPPPPRWAGSFVGPEVSVCGSRDPAAWQTGVF